jgi:[ribosomal protein S5]-alanine N-acetyltransferase
VIAASDDGVVIVTPRLALRTFREDDAAFLVELLNTPGFLRFIGDRGVRNDADAHRYVAEGPAASFATNGHGLMAVVRRDDGERLGMCGMLRRDTLDDPDIGFAFLPRFAGQGFAHEAAAATVHHARDTLKLGRLAAITSPDNDDSIRLLTKLGFRFVKMIQVANDPRETRLFHNDPIAADA